jgi:hypothetical protein
MWGIILRKNGKYNECLIVNAEGSTEIHKKW